MITDDLTPPANAFSHRFRVPSERHRRPRPCEQRELGALGAGRRDRPLTLRRPRARSVQDAWRRLGRAPPRHRISRLGVPDEQIEAVTWVASLKGATASAERFPARLEERRCCTLPPLGCCLSIATGRPTRVPRALEPLRLRQGLNQRPSSRDRFHTKVERSEEFLGSSPNKNALRPSALPVSPNLVSPISGPSFSSSRERLMSARRGHFPGRDHARPTSSSIGVAPSLLVGCSAAYHRQDFGQTALERVSLARACEGPEAARGWAPALGMGRSPIENTGEAGAVGPQFGVAAWRRRSRCKQEGAEPQNPPAGMPSVGLAFPSSCAAGPLAC